MFRASARFFLPGSAGPRASARLLLLHSARQRDAASLYAPVCFLRVSAECAPPRRASALLCARLRASTPERLCALLRAHAHPSRCCAVLRPTNRFFVPLPPRAPLRASARLCALLRASARFCTLALACASTRPFRYARLCATARASARLFAPPLRADARFDMPPPAWRALRAPTSGPCAFERPRSVRIPVRPRASERPCALQRRRAPPGAPLREDGIALGLPSGRASAQLRADCPPGRTSAKSPPNGPCGRASTGLRLNCPCGLALK